MDETVLKPIKEINGHKIYFDGMCYYTRINGMNIVVDESIIELK